MKKRSGTGILPVRKRSGTGILPVNLKMGAGPAGATLFPSSLKTMLVVIDYEAGNLHSVSAALRHLGAEFVCSDDPKTLAKADKAILPGVGSARAAMESLRRRGLLEAIRSCTVPFLGICLGLQVLFEGSDEDDTPCLGLFPGRVRRFDSKLGKVPHIGWNQVRVTGRSALWKGIPDASHFYFVHGYYAPISPGTTLAETDYTVSFASAAGRGNFQAVQFHPELSGDHGLKLLRNFLEAD